MGFKSDGRLTIYDRSFHVFGFAWDIPSDDLRIEYNFVKACKFFKKNSNTLKTQGREIYGDKRINGKRKWTNR